MQEEGTEGKKRVKIILKRERESDGILFPSLLLERNKGRKEREKKKRERGKGRNG